MPEITFEQVLIGIQSLPPESLAKLREILNALSEKEQRVEAARELARAASLRDFSADRQWLKDHRDEYAGQWVALKDGRLISHSPNAKEVFAATDAAGHPDALVVFVESTPTVPILTWVSHVPSHNGRNIQ